jgi:anti-sigma factor RsiW
MGDPHSAFDHERDPLLGEALRAALAPRDTAGFVARVLAAAERRPAPMVDVLARWARVGIAAAILAALAAGFAVAQGTGRSGELVTTGTDAASVIEGVQAPDAVSLIAAFQER